MPPSKHQITFCNPGPPCHEQDVAALEGRLGCRLPAGYRAYLLQHNGASPILDGREDDASQVRLQWRWCDSTFPLGDPAGALGHFYKLGSNPSGAPDLEETLRDYAERIPADTLPIANDSGPSQYLLVLRGDHAGQVFYWSRKHRNDVVGGRLEEYSNVAFVAWSFHAFLDALEPED